MTMRKVQRPPRPTGRPKVQAISKILMAPKQSGPPRKKRPMSPGELKARTGKTVISKRKGKPKFEREKAKPRAMADGGPTGSATLKKRLQKMLDERRKKKKNSLKDKVKEKLKQKKKTKSTKTGLLSKVGLMPVSTPGGIPKVMSQKSAQKDPPKRRPTPGKPPLDKPKDRFTPEILRPKNPPRKFMLMSKNKGGDIKSLASAATSIDSMIKAIKKNPGSVGINKMAMDLARKIKSSGRLSTEDIKRARDMLRKGLKPVLDSKGKPVKNLFQKAGPGKPMSEAQKKQLKRFQEAFKPQMPKTKSKGPKGVIPLMGTAGRGARKGFGSKNLKSAAKKLKRIM